MPVTQISTQVVVGPYPSLPVAATSLDLVFTAADVANGNFFTADQLTASLSVGTVGGDVLIIWNTDAVPHNLTITSQPDDKGRSGNVTTYAVGAGVISAFKFSQLVGWVDGSSNVFISADSALIKFAILKR